MNAHLKNDDVGRTVDKEFGETRGVDGEKQFYFSVNAGIDFANAWNQADVLIDSARKIILAIQCDDCVGEATAVYAHAAGVLLDAAQALHRSVSHGDDRWQKHRNRVLARAEAHHGDR